MADVFLSYARPDAAVAQRVARELTKAGWTVWYDSELPVHRSYADVIAAELAHAPAVLVLWSKAAGWSKWGHERLFLPPMKPAWSDRRFEPLLRRIGLEDYWQQSGSVPDFRRR